MYSIIIRINKVVFYFVFCLGILCLFNILTTLFINKQPTVNDFKVIRWSSLYNNTFLHSQMANGMFNLNVDFDSVFNWNTKLVFFWITASYSTGKDNVVKNIFNILKLTSVTVYDGIIKRNDRKLKYLWKVKQRMFEFPIVDSYFSLKNKQVEYELHWEHMPVIGAIYKNKVSLGTFTLPANTIRPIDAEYINKEIQYYKIGKVSKKSSKR